VRLLGESLVVAGVCFGLDSFGDSATSARQAPGRRAPLFHHEISTSYGMTTWIVLVVFAVVAAVAFVLFAILTLRWLAILIESRRRIEWLCRGGGIRIEKEGSRRRTRHRFPQATRRCALKAESALTTRSRRAHRRTSISDAA
jgi:hypothetical protein